MIEYFPLPVKDYTARKRILEIIKLIHGVETNINPKAEVVLLFLFYFVLYIYIYK